jgi:hypothetical protein
MRDFQLAKACGVNCVKYSMRSPHLRRDTDQLSTTVRPSRAKADRLLPYSTTSSSCVPSTSTCPDTKSRPEQKSAVRGQWSVVSSLREPFINHLDLLTRHLSRKAIESQREASNAARLLRQIFLGSVFSGPYQALSDHLHQDGRGPLDFRH